MRVMSLGFEYYLYLVIFTRVYNHFIMAWSVQWLHTDTISEKQKEISIKFEESNITPLLTIFTFSLNFFDLDVSLEFVFPKAWMLNFKHARDCVHIFMMWMFCFAMSINFFILVGK